MSQPEFVPTPVDDIPKIVERLRRGFKNRSKKSLQQRFDRLHALLDLINDNEAELEQALYSDLHKPKTEAHLSELDMIRNEAWSMINNLKNFMSNKDAEKVGIQKLDEAYTTADPLGVVAILAPWNFPLQLLVMPLCGALAAGNCVVLKPSEIAQNIAIVIARLIPKYFASDDVAVVNGGIPETTALLKEKFDHILYTGNGHVGRIVMSAAAKNLTPVTLELGGKSPAIITKDVDIELCARRIIWSKIVNAGQICIAADYVLVHESKKDELIECFKKAIKEFLGDDPKQSTSYSRIINDNHFNRLLKLVPEMASSKNQKNDDESSPVVVNGSGNDNDNNNTNEDQKKNVIAIGGQHDAATRYIAPTVVLNPDLNSQLMTTEIFGPILPVITVKSLQQAIDFVNERDKPLALYVFSKDSNEIQRVLDETSSGGVTINDTLMHCTCEGLPFGGVGESGMGAYHGKLSFDIFSHKKAVYAKLHGMEFVNEIRYPPYTETKLSWLKRLLAHEGYSCCCLPSFHTILTCLLFCAVVVLAVLFGLKKNC